MDRPSVELCRLCNAVFLGGFYCAVARDSRLSGVFWGVHHSTRRNPRHAENYHGFGLF